MSAELVPILLQGVALGASLCFTLGPQSLFVLRQGMRGERALQVATICSLSDVAMIFAGAAGFGALLAAFPSFTALAGWGSAALVVVYGAMQLTGTLLHAQERRAGPLPPSAPPPARSRRPSPSASSTRRSIWR
jgi:L-lysine exporter family protein LysE/ArgO